jgi:hypothetical protein
MGVNIWENRGKLYLDIWHNGRRRRESLGLTVPSDKTQRAEIMRLAEVCKSKREAQILSGEWGMVDPVGGRQTLIEYMNGIAGGRGQNDFTHKAVKHLESFPGGNISLGGITEKWIEDFQEYLLKETGLSKKTIAHYSGAVRYALRKAARNRIIPRNPAVGVKGISVPESDKIYLTAPEVQALANTPINGELGVGIYTLSKLLGHTDVKTTRIYANATDKMKREAVNTLPVIEIK